MSFEFLSSDMLVLIWFRECRAAVSITIQYEGNSAGFAGIGLQYTKTIYDRFLTARRKCESLFYDCDSQFD